MLENKSELIGQHVAQLMEHFESVRIIATHNALDGSGDYVLTSGGGGSWYAQMGSVQTWYSGKLHKEAGHHFTMGQEGM